MKKLIYTLLIIIALTNNSFSAGTSSDTDSLLKFNYTKAKNLIKAAKNMKKKVKLKKHKKDMQKHKSFF